MALIRAQRGLISKIAAELGISQSAVSMWERVPAERVVEIERIVGIPRHRLRPDLHLPPDSPAFATLTHSPRRARRNPDEPSAGRI
jgi:pyruvate kinase